MLLRQPGAHDRTEDRRDRAGEESCTDDDAAKDGDVLRVGLHGDSGDEGTGAVMFPTSGAIPPAPREPLQAGCRIQTFGSTYVPRPSQKTTGTRAPGTT